MKTIERSGYTSSAKVKAFLNQMISVVEGTRFITGGMQVSDNECSLNFMLDGNTLMSINIQDMGGQLV